MKIVSEICFKGMPRIIIWLRISTFSNKVVAEVKAPNPHDFILYCGHF